MKWQQAKWSEVLDIKNGKDQKKVADLNGQYPIYGSGGPMGFANDYLCEPGTTVVGRKGSINSPIYVNERFWNVDTAFGLSPKSGLDNRFLFHFCIQYNFLKHNKATTLPSLTKTDLLNIEIPLPPLAEQKRIAAILDAADALRTKRRESLAQLDALLQSTFLTLFGDPVSNPMGWEMTALKKAAPAQPARLSALPHGDTWLLNLDQIESQSGKILKKIMADASTAGSSTQAFDTGNVLYSKLRPYLNKVVCPDSFGIATTELVPLRPNPKQLDRQYLTHYLRSKSFVSWVSIQVAGAKMPRVSMKVFWDHEIPLPPLPLQQKFAAIVESIERQKAAQRAHLAELDALFAALQHRAFRGEL
jgi:type I restriction enzyme S subunit